MAERHPFEWGEAELDILSGRPNPRWPLTGEQLRIVEEKLAGLTPSRHDGPADSLGYRGIRLHLRRNGAPLLVRVAAGRVEMGEAVLVDPAASLEHYLISTMPAEMRRSFHAVLPGPPSP